MLCYCCCVLYCSIWFLFYSTLFFLFFLSLSFSTWFTTNYRRKIQIQSSLKLSNTFVLVSFLRFFSGCSVLFCSRASFSVLFFLKKIYLKKYLADDKIKISFSQKCLQKFSITFLVMYERRSSSTQMTALLFILAGMCFFILTMPRSQHYLIKSD